MPSIPISLSGLLSSYYCLEYFLRVITLRHDPYYGKFSFAGERFATSSSTFTWLIDLLAIFPFYVAEASPGGWVDQMMVTWMLRILRVVKLDKYVPSITLLDDVLRLKKNALFVTGFAAGTLWILFSALLYLTESVDTEDAVDDLPLYGCDGNCSQATRFSNVFASMEYTMIHLTGDYPIIEYSLSGRIINFFMVICAVGVVSIPSGLIADGFSQVVEDRGKKVVI